MLLDPDDSPLRVESLDPGLNEIILDITIHPIIFRITQEILQHPIAKVSRSGIYKTEIQADILQFFQEIEFINQDYMQKYCKIVLQKSQEVKFVKHKYRQRYCKFFKR